MFRNWLQQWRRRRSGIYFRYFDGQRVRYGDPLQLYRAFVHHPANLAVLAPAVDEQKEPETSQFLQAICEIFGLWRYDPVAGRGLTDAEILGVVDQFYRYLDEVKKKLGPGLTFLPPTAGESSGSKGRRP